MSYNSTSYEQQGVSKLYVRKLYDHATGKDPQDNRYGTQRKQCTKRRDFQINHNVSYVDRAM